MKLIVKTPDTVERFNTVEDYINRIKAKSALKDRYPEFMEELNDPYYYFKPKVKELKR